MKKALFILTMFIGSTGYSQTTFYVDQSATGLNDGSSWANAYTDLESAVSTATATANNDIWVKQGTYIPSDSAANRFLLLTNGVHLYGGFDGSESSLNQRDPKNNITILDGDAYQDDSGPVNIFNSSRSDNAYTVVYMMPTNSTSNRGVLIDGFTIRGGNSRSNLQYNDFRYGGGVFVSSNNSGSATDFNTSKISNCIIEYNSAHYQGGVATRPLMQRACLTVIENTIFRENGSTADVVGNSAQGYPAATIITNCLFERNSVSVGNIVTTSTENQNYSSGVFIINSTFAENNIGSNKTILLVNNPFSSGASVRMEVYNSIFSEPFGDTLVKQSAGGIADTCTLKNNVINSPQLLFSGNFTHIQSLNNLVATAPEFVGGGNYELSASSPAIGLGELVDYNKYYLDPNVPFTAPTEDIGGNMIPTSGTNLDAGAYQYVSTSSLEENISSTIQSIYPNPTNSELNIQVDKNIQIHIYNNQGATIYSQQLKKGTNQIATKSLSPGMYFIQTEAGEYHKFIKK